MTGLTLQGRKELVFYSFSHADGSISCSWPFRWTPAETTCCEWMAAPAIKTPDSGQVEHWRANPRSDHSQYMILFHAAP